MHQKKSRFVNAMIYILVIGLILIVVGYYPDDDEKGEYDLELSRLNIW